MRALRLPFEVEPSYFEERTDAALGPHEIARRLALGKARAVAARRTDALVIAADTIVVLEGRALGKPASDAEAQEMLRALSGRAHTVITGFVVLDARNGGEVKESVETTVHVRPLTDAEIEAYIATGEPRDKAGAYGIQGLGAVIVERVEGDYFNVVGLPLNALARALKSFGVNVLSPSG